MVVFEIINLSIVIIILALVYFTNEIDIKHLSILNMFTKTVLYIIENIFKYNYNSKYDQLIFNKYVRLNGKTNAKNNFRIYVGHKFAYMMMGVFIVSAFSLIFCITVKQNEVRLDENCLMRPDFRQENKNVKLYVDLEKKGVKITQPIDIELNQQDPNSKQQKEHFGKFMESLNDYMGNHKSIKSNIFLPIEINGINIEWSSNDCSIINNKGEIIDGKVKDEGKQVILTAQIKYYSQKLSKQYYVTVYPKVNVNKSETLNDIYNEINANIQSGVYETKDKIVLPNSINTDKDIEITWRVEKNTDPILFFCISSLIVFLMFFIKDKELDRMIEKKEIEMKLEFPNFISKFTLLINAGMNVTKALEKIVCDNKLKKSILIDELKKTLYEIKSGTYESQAIMNLSYRNELIELKKFANLINQNLKKGNDQLLIKLSQLNHELWQERKQTALRLGEEAETKMLLPMVLMLIVLLIIVITPAMESLKI